MRVGLRATTIVLTVCVLPLGLGACFGGASPYDAAEEEDVPGLVAMAEDTTKDLYGVREVAVQKLGELGTPEAVDVLLDWAQNGAPPDLEYAVLTALGATGDPRAIDPLLAALGTVDRSKLAMELQPDEEMRLWAVMRGLAGLQDPRVAEALLAELDAGHAAAISEIELAEALAGQGAGIAAALEQRLANSDAYVFVPAAWALCDIYSSGGNDARVSELLTAPATFRIYDGVLAGRASVEPQEVVDSLNAVGDARMAQEMLNTGSELWEEAATEWAAVHGYTIESWITSP